MNEIGILLSSGVGQTPRISDGIGDLAQILSGIPGVEVRVNRIATNRGRMLASLKEAAKWLDQFERCIAAGHSRGGKFVCDVAFYARAIDFMALADPWSRHDVVTVWPNVKRGESWTQIGSWPQGVAVRAQFEQAAWTQHPPLTDVPHNKMDALPEFHAAVISAAKGFT